MKRKPKVTRRAGRDIKPRFNDFRKWETQHADHNAHVYVYYEYMARQKPRDNSGAAAVLAMVGMGLVGLAR